MFGSIRRRTFLKNTLAGAATLAAAARQGRGARSGDAVKPAVLGGKPVREAAFPSWPQVSEGDEAGWLDVLRARGWYRFSGDRVAAYEAEMRSRLGVSYCLATSSGTGALFTAINALEVGPGDEVLVPPYTFGATINVVLLQYALPVFVDTDCNTFQMDAKKIDAAITERTRCMIPVHLGGNVCDMDAILEISRRRGIPVIEDACQSHMAEWRGKKVGSLGDAGCFSHQVSKNLSAGEGGLIATNREDLYESCHGFHSNGRGTKSKPGYTYARNGCNLRMTEFQGSLLLAQLARFDEQCRVRETNAQYLTERLRAIPGIAPAAHYEGCTRDAYHLYMMRYNSVAFGGLSRDGFLRALRAEGIPCSSGYTRLNQEPYLRDTLYSRGFLRVFGKARIDEYFEQNQCPENDRLCDEAVWLTQNMLLGPRSDMDDIVNAVEKIHAHAAAIAAA